MDNQTKEDLKDILDSFYKDFDFNKHIEKDPIEFPHKYKNPSDIEIVGFIAASFAYGRVSIFKPVIAKILSKMGGSPASFLHNFNPKKDSKRFAGIIYRFNKNNDILALLYALHKVLRNFGTLENLFRCTPPSLTSGTIVHVEKSIIDFTLYFHALDLSPIYGNQVKTPPKGFLQFFPNPTKKSPCKRLNMFLRWMSRTKDIDFGIWNSLKPNQLIIPLDVHIARISKCLGLTERTTSQWQTACEITESLRVFDPEDPIKYDFALCHYGISGKCKSIRDESTCPSCVLNFSN